jgi:large conductance mechanosensitive channel
VLKEFKDFIMKGNLLEVAVGLILALAFKAVVDEVVNIINQVIAFILGSTTPFSQLAITSGTGEDQKSIVYGGFLNAVFSFIVVGFVLFLIVKAYNRMVDMAGRKGETEETAEDSAEVVLLREIRDALVTGGGDPLPKG